MPTLRRLLRSLGFGAVRGLESAVMFFVPQTDAFRQASKLPRMKRALIGDLRPDPDASPRRLTKIIGTVRTLEPPLLAPLSQRPCVFYLLEVETRDRQIVFRGDRRQDFLVADETGAVRVAVATALFEPKLPGLSPSGPALKAFLASQGVTVTGRSGKDPELFYREYRIEAGDPVGACGQAVSEHVGEAAVGPYREGVPRLVLTSTRKRRVCVTNNSWWLV